MQEKIKISPSRVVSYKVLHEVLFRGSYSNISLNKQLNASIKNEADANLATNITYGTLKKINKIKDVLSKVSNTSIEEIDEKVLISLYMGIYQILYLDKVPEYAIVNDSVNIAKFYVSKKSASFVNGILRNVLRKKQEFLDVKYDDFYERMLYEYSFSEQVVDILLKSYSKLQLEEYAKKSLEAPITTIRVNTLKNSTKELINLLKEQEFIGEKTFVPNSLEIKRARGIASLKAFKEGRFFIQDLAGMILGYTLELKENLNVLDMCAAPGGKSINAALLMNNKGVISANDIYPKKIELINLNAKKMGVNIIEAKKKDSLSFDENEVGKYDRVILDAPCSGLGVIRRKSEILLRVNKEGIEDLKTIQFNLLNNAVKYAKRGGIIAYSTCTINKEENEEIVNKVLNENKDISLEEIKLDFNLPSFHEEMKKGFLNLSLINDNCDGFFIAKIRKK